MTTATPIDLSLLPFPDVVKKLDFETVFAERKAALLQLIAPERRAEVEATLKLESEPITVLLQESAYRETLLIQRINDSARAMTLAYARGADLDNLAALLGVVRQVIQQADPVHDIPELKESDDDLRQRVLLAPHGFSVAGPSGAYISKARNADGAVLDAAVDSPSKGQVRVTILSRHGDGSAGSDLLAKVHGALSADTERPLTDEVVVQSATLTAYKVVAKLFMSPGPDRSIALAEAQRRLQAYVESCHRIGRLVAVSGIDSALHVAGVERVSLVEPVADILTAIPAAPYCTSIEVTSA